MNINGYSYRIMHHAMACLCLMILLPASLRAEPLFDVHLHDNAAAFFDQSVDRRQKEVA